MKIYELAGCKSLADYHLHIIYALEEVGWDITYKVRFERGVKRVYPLEIGDQKFTMHTRKAAMDCLFKTFDETFHVTLDENSKIDN